MSLLGGASPLNTAGSPGSTSGLHAVLDSGPSQLQSSSCPEWWLLAVTWPRVGGGGGGLWTAESWVVSFPHLTLKRMILLGGCYGHVLPKLLVLSGFRAPLPASSENHLTASPGVASQAAHTYTSFHGPRPRGSLHLWVTAALYPLWKHRGLAFTARLPACPQLRTETTPLCFCLCLHGWFWGSDCFVYFE